MTSHRLLWLVAALSALALSCSRSALTYVERGDRLLQQNKFADASLQYRKAIQQDPKLGEAYYGLAMSSLKDGKPGDVLPNLNRAGQLSPGNEKVKEQLADLVLSLYLNSGTRSSAVHDQLVGLSSELLKTSTGSFQAHRISGYLAFTDDNSPEAIVEFEKADRLKPGSPEIALMIAQSIFLKGDPGEAERRARAVVVRHPAYAPAYDWLYAQMARAKRYSDCEELLKLKREKNPKEPLFAIQLAGFYHGQGKILQRDAVLQDLFAHARELPDAALLLADFDLQIGEWRKALDILQAGLQMQPQKAETYLTRKASILTEHREAGTALTEVDSYLAKTRPDAVLRTVRDNLILDSQETRRLPEAVSDLLDLQKNNPENATVHFQLGRAYLLEGKLDDAMRQFRDAIKQDSRALGPRLALVQLLLNTGRYAGALRECEGVLAMAPGQPQALAARIASLSGLGQYDQAHAALKEALARVGPKSDIAAEEAFLNVAEKNYTDAEKTLREHYRPGDQNLRPLAGLVAALKGQGKLDAAIQTIQQDLSASPNRPFVLLMLAQITAERAPAEAVQQLERLVSARPQFFPAQMALGELYIRQGQPQKAIIPLERAHDLNPTDTAPLLLLSGALEQANQPQKAKQVYADWLKQDPDNPVALNNLASLESETGGDLDEALRLAQRAHNKAPNDANISDTIGLIYIDKRMYPSALQVFQYLSRQYPHNAIFRFHNGLAWLGSSNPMKAKTEFLTALSEKPSSSIVGKINEALNQLQAAR